MRKSLNTTVHDRLLKLLRDHRKAAGLTQQQVADTLGRPQSFVAKYEGGERRPDVLEFIEVARALRADPAELFRSINLNSII